LLIRYHSHPKFAPDPSLIDLYNQRNYQNLFKEDKGTTEPFVGAICAPYDPKLPKSISAFNWFYVGNGDDDKNRPKQLRYDPQSFKNLDESELEGLTELIGECGARSDRVDFQEGWRKDRWESKLEKLKSSLESHFDDGSDFQPFWTRIGSEIGKWRTLVEE
jgi:hypothetical protein